MTEMNERLTEKDFITVNVNGFEDWIIDEDKVKQILENQEKLEKMGKELQKRIDEETKHINHPKQIYRSVQHNCEYNLRVCEILKEILGDSTS